MLLASADPSEVAAAADPWLGRVIDGRYRVQARLGTGGMGVVYRVEHLHLGKTAAMKVLAPDTAEKSEAVRRFRLEAQSVSKLNHPNIVQTFDFGQADGALYLVMEFIKGDDLASLLRREGPWTFQRAARFFIQVCSGLTEAHDAGIVHRDLKPENLMVVHRRDVGAREDPRLRSGEAARARPRSARHQLGRAGDRDAVLHGARTGARRGSRRARRHLQPGRDAVPRVDGRAAVRRAVADERALEAPHRRRRAAAQPRARPIAAARRGSHRAARDGEVRRGSLRVGRGGAARSRARARVAGRGAAIGGDGRAAAARRAADGARHGRGAHVAARRCVGAREHGLVGCGDRRGSRRHGSRDLIGAFDLRGGLDLGGGQRPGSPASLRRRRLRMDAAPATAGAAAGVSADRDAGGGRGRGRLGSPSLGARPPTGWSTSRTTRRGMRRCWCRGRYAARSARR